MKRKTLILNFDNQGNPVIDGSKFHSNKESPQIIQLRNEIENLNYKYKRLKKTFMDNSTKLVAHEDKILSLEKTIEEKEAENDALRTKVAEIIVYLDRSSEGDLVKPKF